MESLLAPTFQGVNDKYLSSKQFLFIFEHLSRANHWDDTEKCQELKHLVQDMGIDHCQDYQDCKKVILNNIRPIMTLQEKIDLRLSLVQAMDESVQDFYQRCLRAQSLFSDDYYSEFLDERELLMNFVNGLKNSIKEVLLQDVNDTNLESFVVSAMQIEMSNDDHAPREPHFEDHDISFEELPTLDFQDDVKVFRCDLCGFAYTTMELLTDHKAKEHLSDKSKIKCHHCPVTFSTKKIYSYHMQNIHPDSCFQCHICNQVLYNETKLSSHYKTKHAAVSPKSELQCEFCSNTYFNKNSLKAHIHSKHLSTKSFPCKVCPKVFNSSSNLKTHVRIVHLMERPYECKDCEKAYASEGGLVAHQASIHGKGERLQCDECDMTFPYKSALTKHVLNRHNRGTFICDQCGAANNTKEALRVHKIRDHSNDKGKKLTCPFAPDCKEMFRLPFQIRNHVKRVHNKVEGSHECHLCSKKYHSKQRLESHINGVHLNKKPHKCPHCDFASAYPGHVKDHIRASHDAMKYPCPYPMCNHQSSYKGNLDKHIKNIHTKHSSTTLLPVATSS